MILARLACALLAPASLIFVSAGALAQSTAGQPPPHVPLQKTIGQAQADIVPSLIVLNALGATLRCHNGNG